VLTGFWVDPVPGASDPVPTFVECEVGAFGFDDGRATQIADVHEDDVTVRGRDRDRSFWKYNAHRVPPRTASDR